jgi:phage/plasmid-like protein (TIGR03299 family)
MAAEIDSLAFFGATPWHGLGAVLDGSERTNVLEAMRRSGTDWLVERVALAYGQGIKVPDAWGILRQDTGKYLGTVGKNTHPIQNHEAFSLLEPFVESGCKIEVMGGLSGGREIFGLLSMPDADVAPSPGDDVKGYFLVASAHDGTSALKATLTPIRVVCKNTLNLANTSERTVAVSVRHSKQAKDRIEQAKETLEKMAEVFALTGETFKAMAEREMRPKDIQAFMDAILPSKVDADGDASPAVEARREKIVELGFHGAGQNYNGDSLPLWALYNGVTEYFDHERAKEAKSTSMAVKSGESALFGLNAQIKARAFQQAARMVA